MKINHESHAWWSPRLERRMELLVFGHAGAKVFVFPTRGGRFFEYENLRLVDSVRWKLEAGALQLYCLDSIDTGSFYCWWAHPSGRLQRHLQFEQCVLEEVLPLADPKNPHPCRIAHGCSLGAYHAANRLGRPASVLRRRLRPRQTHHPLPFARVGSRPIASPAKAPAGTSRGFMIKR